jgi:hypothetical protein
MLKGTHKSKHINNVGKTNIAGQQQKHDHHSSLKKAIPVISPYSKTYHLLHSCFNLIKTNSTFSKDKSGKGYTV